MVFCVQTTVLLLWTWYLYSVMLDHMNTMNMPRDLGIPVDPGGYIM